jgi:hypothetical protein
MRGRSIRWALYQELDAIQGSHANSSLSHYLDEKESRGREEAKDATQARTPGPACVDQRLAFFMRGEVVQHFVDGLIEFFFVLLWIVAERVTRHTPPDQLLVMGIVEVQHE